jgi:signal transduction histidine kinase
MYRYLFIIMCFFTCKKHAIGQEINDTSTYKKMLSNALYNYDALGDSLIEYAQAFFAFAEKYPYPEAAIQGYKMLGIYHEVNAAYDSALYYYQKAENRAKADKNEDALTALLFDKMSVHLELQQYEQAQDALNRALHRSSEAGNKKLMSVAWSNLGIIYRRTGKMDSAYYAYTQSLQLKEALQDIVGIANTRTNMASLLVSTNRFKEALELLKLNIQFYRQEKRYGELWYGYMSSSEAYRGLNNLLLAEKYADSAGLLIEQYQMPQRLPTLLNIKAAIAYSKGAYKTAYELRDSASRLENDRINDETRQQITELNEKYQVKQKDNQNRLLGTQLANKALQQRNLTIAATSLAIIALISFLAWRNIRTKKVLLEKQNSLIAAQNEQLTQLNSDKNQLISMVSHDLKQPFIQLQVWTDLLQKQLIHPTPQTHESITYIKKSIEQGQQLIQHVLTIEKMGANARNLALVHIVLADFLKQLIEDFQPAARGKNISLAVAASNDISLETDEQHLRQIIENLVSNALKFSPEGSQVLLSGSKSDNQIAITVQDNGPGMSEDELSTIFNKYTIAGPRPTGDENSTGLGLSIVKRLMLELGGNIEVKSKKGEGTTFKLLFK